MLLLECLYVGRRRRSQYIIAHMRHCNATNIILHVCVIATLSMLRRDATTVYSLVASLQAIVLLRCTHCYVACVCVRVFSSCQYPQAIRKQGCRYGVHYVSAIRKQGYRCALHIRKQGYRYGVPYVVSASRGAGVPYVLSSVPYVSPAAAIDLATGNRNVD